MIKSFKYLFYYECLLLLRRSQEWLYPLGFFAVIMTLFPLAFTPDPAFLQRYMPDAIWIAALLASLLSLEHVFAADREDGFLDQLLLTPLPLTLLLLTQLAAQWVITLLPLILFTPLIGLFFHLPLNVIAVLCMGLLLGTPMLLLIGSLGAALTLGLRQQGVLLSLLVLPLVIPILIFGVNLVQEVQAGLSIAGPLAFLTGLFFLALTLLPPAIAATVRMGVDG